MTNSDLRDHVTSLRNAIKYQRELVAEGMYPFGVPRIDLEHVERCLDRYLMEGEG